MGFAQPAGHPAAGELLPHHFTLARTSVEAGRWRHVSVALSVGSPLLGVTQHPARWSSDFPPTIGGRSPDLLSPQSNYIIWHRGDYGNWTTSPLVLGCRLGPRDKNMSDSRLGCRYWRVLLVPEGMGVLLCAAVKVYTFCPKPTDK